MTHTPVEVARALLEWDYHTSAEEKARALFPRTHPAYLAEKVTRANEGLFQLFLTLDQENKERLLDLALARYDATRRKVRAP